MPRRPVIASLFGRSPFHALQEHMRAVLDCVREVPGLFDALAGGDQELVAEIKQRIFEKEHAADEVKNVLRSHLPKGLFMPVDRRDLLEILQTQDSIADTAQDIAGLLVERRMGLPQPLVEPVLELVKSCVAVCEEALGIIEHLDELLELGFRGKAVDRMVAMCDSLNASESVTDELGQRASQVLFAHEDELKPVSVMMWYRLIEWIGDLADYAEKVGNRLRLLLAS